MPAPIVFDKERVHFNVARIKKAGENFELDINPDKAMEYKSGKDVDIKDVLNSENIFTDVKKGIRASETRIMDLFGTNDNIKVAEIIIRQGEIQLTEEYRDRQREEKRKSIVTLIARNAVDPRSGYPHPPDRISRAMDEAKVKIDYYKKAEDQVRDIVKQMQVVLPIKFENAVIELRIPAVHAVRAYSVLKNFGEIASEEWLSDASLSAKIRMPAGMQQQFFDALNKIAHGEVESKITRE
jgi:ribosome maturation protein SDO1